MVSSVSTLIASAVSAACRDSSSGVSACALAALKLKAEGPVIAGIAIIYAIAMFIGSGWEATLWGLGLMLIGLPIRWFSRKRWPNRVAVQEA